MTFAFLAFLLACAIIIVALTMIVMEKEPDPRPRTIEEMAEFTSEYNELSRQLRQTEDADSGKMYVLRYSGWSGWYNEFSIEQYEARQLLSARKKRISDQLVELERKVNQ